MPDHACGDNTKAGRNPILFVSAVRHDQAELRRILGSHSHPMIAASCRRGLSRLRNSDVALVICDDELPDGSWLDFLNGTAADLLPPLLIVTSRRADNRLWSEVLNMGAFDLIAKPFRDTEVLHVVMTARLHAQSRHGMHYPASV